MLKLVTQFDSKESKISLATPTCGGCCCCCCCCLVSTIIAPVIATRSFEGVWIKDEAGIVKLHQESILGSDKPIEVVGKDTSVRGLFVLLFLLSAAVIVSLFFLRSSLHNPNALIGPLTALGAAGGLYGYIFSRILKRGYSAKRIVFRNISGLLIWAALAAFEFLTFVPLVLAAPAIYIIFIIAAIIAAIALMVRS